MPVLLRAILGALCGGLTVWMALLALRPGRWARTDPGTRLIFVGGELSLVALTLEAIFPYGSESGSTRVVTIAIVVALLVVGQVLLQTGIQVRARRARRNAVIQAQAGGPDGTPR